MIPSGEVNVVVLVVVLNPIDVLANNALFGKVFVTWTGFLCLFGLQGTTCSETGEQPVRLIVLELGSAFGARQPEF